MINKGVGFFGSCGYTCVFYWQHQATLKVRLRFEPKDIFICQDDYNYLSQKIVITMADCELCVSPVQKALPMWLCEVCMANQLRVNNAVALANN